MENNIIKIEDKDDRFKERYDLIHPEYLKRLAQLLTYGSLKYETDYKFLHITDNENRIYNSMMRHLLEIKKDKWAQDESGYKHLYHFIANAYMYFVLCEHEVKNELLMDKK